MVTTTETAPDATLAGTRVDLDRNPAQLDKLRDQVTELTRRVAERQRTDNVTPD